MRTSLKRTIITSKPAGRKSNSEKSNKRRYDSIGFIEEFNYLTFFNSVVLKVKTYRTESMMTLLIYRPFQRQFEKRAKLIVKSMLMNKRANDHSEMNQVVDDISVVIRRVRIC